MGSEQPPFELQPAPPSGGPHPLTTKGEQQHASLIMVLILSSALSMTPDFVDKVSPHGAV